MTDETKDSITISQLKKKLHYALLKADEFTKLHNSGTKSKFIEEVGGEIDGLSKMPENLMFSVTSSEVLKAISKVEAAVSPKLNMEIVKIIAKKEFTTNDYEKVQKLLHELKLTE